MKMKYSWLALGPALLGLAFVTPGSLLTRSETPLCETGLASFQKGMHPFLRERCASCHGEGGSGPGHSVSDPVKSYIKFRKLVDFSDPERSQAMEGVRSRHWLDYDPAAQGARPEELLERLAAWWNEGENECSTATMITTDALPVPSDLPAASADRYVPLRWSLAHLGPGFSGSFFELEIQRFSNPQAGNLGSYRVRKPRLVARDSALAIQGLWLSVNGRINSAENAYSFVDRVVSPRAGGAAAAEGFPVLSPQEMILLERDAKGDSIALSFERIAPVAGRACRDLQGFSQKVLPALKRNCAQCHGALSAPAFKSFPILPEGDAGSICAEALERSDTRWPDGSAMIAYPVSQVHGHPGVFASGTVASQFKRSFADWIRSER
jgi:mono/diheme cytochrome c family protein